MYFTTKLMYDTLGQVLKIALCRKRIGIDRCFRDVSPETRSLNVLDVEPKPAHHPLQV